MEQLKDLKDLEVRAIFVPYRLRAKGVAMTRKAQLLGQVAGKTTVVDVWFVNVRKREQILPALRQINEGFDGGQFAVDFPFLTKEIRELLSKADDLLYGDEPPAELVKQIAKGLGITWLHPKHCVYLK